MNAKRAFVFLMRRFSLLLIALSLSVVALAHAYHASLMQVRYNATKQRLEVALKVFTDDFEKALFVGQAAPVSLEESPKAQTTALTTALLRRSVVLGTRPGEALPLQFLGFEKENDSHWLYFSVQLTQPVTSIYLQNKVLMDVFPDQTNIVNVEANGKQTSSLFRDTNAQKISW